MEKGNVGYTGIKKELTNKQRNDLIYNVYVKLLKQTPINDSAMIKIDGMLKFYESVEDYERCGEIMNLISENKRIFELI